MVQSGDSRLVLTSHGERPIVAVRRRAEAAAQATHGFDFVPDTLPAEESKYPSAAERAVRVQGIAKSLGQAATKPRSGSRHVPVPTPDCRVRGRYVYQIPARRPSEMEGPDPGRSHCRQSASASRRPDRTSGKINLQWQ